MGVRLPSLPVAACAVLLFAWPIWAQPQLPATSQGASSSGPRRLFEPTALAPVQMAGGARELLPFQRRVRLAVPSMTSLRATAAELPTTTPADRPVLEVTLFDDASFEIAIDRSEIRGPDRFTLYGHVAGVSDSRVVLVAEGDALAGTVSVPLATFQIRSVPGGLHLVEELDDNGFPDEIPPVPMPPALEPDAGTGPVVSADDGSFVDVLVLYTAQARAAAGGTDQMTALVNLAVANSNNSYANSQVTQRLRLVHSAETGYGESGDMGTDLSRLRSTSDGYADEAHTLRETHRADLVSLLVESSQYCGIAYVMTSVSTSFASNGFSVVARSCAGSYLSFAHELGHNMGLTHDPANGGSAAYPFAYGYQDPQGYFRTVMAYSNGCAYPCTRVQHFSNPNVFYNGRVTGVANAQDNARALNLTAGTVANFRAASVASPPGAFGKSSPPNGTTGAQISTTLAWSSSSGATGYSVCYDTSNDNACNGGFQNVGASQGLAVAGLTAGTTYYWQVRASNGDGTTDANGGAWWSFVTMPPPPGAFSKSAPTSGATGQPLTPAVTWSSSSGATSYAVCVDTTNNNTCDAGYTNVGTATTWNVTGVYPAGLAPNTTYHWQVRAANAGGTTDANLGTWWSFTTAGVANDACAQATTITAPPFDHQVDTTLATMDGSDPFPPVGNGARDRSVWYRFTATRGGRLLVATTGSAYDTIVSAWSGTCGALGGVADGANDNYVGLQSRIALRVTTGQSYLVMVTSASGSGGTLRVQARWVPSDFTGDGRTELGVLRQPSGAWFVSEAGSWTWGTNGDLPVQGDYDGDARTDLAVYRPTNGGWFVAHSSTGFASAAGVTWGTAGDVPVPGDYDGDGRLDFAVWRPSDGGWYIVGSSTGTATGTAWGSGAAADVPVPADYDGDGRVDIAVYRPGSPGAFYYVRSSNGTAAGVAWGESGDIAVPADYDGDGKADLAVFRPSTGAWFVVPSGGGSSYAVRWGTTGDQPVTGDFDGDGRMDIAVYRPGGAVSAFYYIRSSDGTSVGQAWGQAGDVPLRAR